ncbi:MAG: hypothetical protein HEP71_05395 [Roseivirga sp.]|nr:hypothetical protein [Roseivirga sp.]
MISYLIQSSVCLAVFYSFYRIFLHREKLLSINRFYLIVTSTISMLIPLLDIKYQSQAVSPLRDIGTEITTTDSTLIDLQSFPLQSIYFTGLVISLILFTIRLLKAKRRIGNSFSYQRNPAIIEVSENEAYSFFNTIFIGKRLTQDPNLKAHILAHETAHIKGLHFIDLIYFELVKCAFWFNPFSYFYSGAVKLQHEYIADQCALEVADVETYEQSLLQFTLSKIDDSLIAGFGQHPIQQRLKMINKLNSNIMNKLKPLFAIPILAILFISFACSEAPIPDSDQVPEEIIAEVAELPVVVEVTTEPHDIIIYTYENPSAPHEIAIGVSSTPRKYTASSNEKVIEVLEHEIHALNISQKESPSSARAVYEERESGNQK